MEVFIKKFLQKQNLLEIECIDFIKKYCVLCGKNEPDINQSNLIFKLLQSGILDFNHIINKSIDLLNMKITTLLDKNGNVIKFYFT